MQKSNLSPRQHVSLSPSLSLYLPLSLRILGLRHGNSNPHNSAFCRDWVHALEPPRKPPFSISPPLLQRWSGPVRKSARKGERERERRVCHSRANTRKSTPGDGRINRMGRYLSTRKYAQPGTEGLGEESPVKRGGCCFGSCLDTGVDDESVIACDLGRSWPVRPRSPFAPTSASPQAARSDSPCPPPGLLELKDIAKDEGKIRRRKPWVPVFTFVFARAMVSGSDVRWPVLASRCGSAAVRQGDEKMYTRIYRARPNYAEPSLAIALYSVQQTDQTPALPVPAPTRLHPKSPPPSRPPPRARRNTACRCAPQTCRGRR